MAIYSAAMLSYSYTMHTWLCWLCVRKSGLVVLGSPSTRYHAYESIVEAVWSLLCSFSSCGLWTPCWPGEWSSHGWQGHNIWNGCTLLLQRWLHDCGRSIWTATVYHQRPVEWRSTQMWTYVYHSAARFVEFLSWRDCVYLVYLVHYSILQECIRTGS